MITIDDIRRLSESERPDLPSYQNCGIINQSLCDTLSSELGINAEFVIGSVSTKPRGVADEHAYIRIPQSEVADAESDVIVDGALDQFNISNYDGGEKWVSLGPKEDIPCPAVLTKQSELYGVFFENTPL